MARLFFQYMAFTTMKVYSFDKIFAKVGFKFCQILNKSLKDCQRVLKFCQCCEISPILVTLRQEDKEPKKICQSCSRPYIVIS